MADDREEGMDGIRETDLNDDVISGAIGTNAITSIDLEEEDPRRFPGMDEMLKVATDLQDSGHSVQLNDSPAATPRLELENSGEEHITYLTAEAILLLFFFVSQHRFESFPVLSKRIWHIIHTFGQASTFQ